MFPENQNILKIIHKLLFTILNITFLSFTKAYEKNCQDQVNFYFIREIREKDHQISTKFAEFSKFVSYHKIPFIYVNLFVLIVLIIKYWWQIRNSTEKLKFAWTINNLAIHDQFNKFSVKFFRKTSKTSINSINLKK